MSEVISTIMTYTEICIRGLDPTKVGGLNRWHGRNHWFYLDNRKINSVACPLVNLGLGCPISLAEAITLPFEVMGQKAEIDQITGDFVAVSRAPFNYRPAGYEDFTLCRLPEDEVDALVMRRFELFVTVLRQMFSEFDAWPEAAKAGLLDLFYALGISTALTYFSLLEALRVQDFATASHRCKEDLIVPAFIERNEARSKLFSAAAKENC